MTIPKIIHRMWLDKNMDDNDVYPKKYNKFTKTFDDFNPEFTIEFWNIKRVNKLFDDYPALAKYRSLWKKVPHHIQKCDIGRYIVMYVYGGIYADLDFIFYRNLTPLLDRELLLVAEPTEYTASDEKFGARLCCGFIGSIPQHQFWLDWLDYIVISLRHTKDVLKTTGPTNFRMFFDQSDYSNTSLINTCDIIPIYYMNGHHYITENCIARNGGSNKYSDDYHVKFGNYADNKWTDGTGWGDLTLNPQENFDSVFNDNGIFSKTNGRLILLLIIVILVFLIFYLIRINNVD